MKYFTAIFLVCLISYVSGQPLTKEYIDNWILKCDSTVDVSAVKAYYLNTGDSVEYFDLIHEDSEFRLRLSGIDVSQLRSVTYSSKNACNYVPGRGRIFLFTISKKSRDNAQSHLDWAKKEVHGNGELFLKTDNPVLVIDGNQIHHVEASRTLKQIKVEHIYDIDVNTYFPVPASLYGENAKNGIIQIWTKEYIKLRPELIGKKT